MFVFVALRRRTKNEVIFMNFQHENMHYSNKFTTITTTINSKLFKFKIFKSCININDVEYHFDSYDGVEILQNSFHMILGNDGQFLAGRG